MSGSFSYLELHTHAPAQAREFYRRLFDWKLSDMEIPGMATYTSIDTGAGPSGGMTKAQSPAQPSAWMVYMNVDDLAVAARQVRELGGKVLQERIEVPGQGALAVVADPTGAVFNLWQKA
jgi:predicted enzyme related to lactoylglutathione lyase